MTLAEVVGKLKIDEETKHTYTRMAVIFEEDLENNLYRTPFELASETGIPYDKWSKFLDITEISSWVDETIRAVTRVGERKIISDIGRGKGTNKDVNAFKAIKEYNTKDGEKDNTNVVIMYLPPDEEEGGE